MNAKVISRLDLHLTTNYDQIAKNCDPPGACCTSHLSFGSSISNSKPRLVSRKTSAVAFRTGVKVRAMGTSTLLPETKTKETFYDLLGISESGTLSEIKKAYKQLARKYHPDVSPPERTEEYTKRFILVQEAYEILSDPQSKAMYDGDLARGLHSAFSARRRSRFDKEWVEKEGWRARWQSQLKELHRRNENRVPNMSWGATMRRQTNDC